MARRSRKRGRVRVVKRRRTSLNWNAIAVMLLVTSFGIGVLYLRTSMRRMLQQTRQLEKQVENLIQENKQLQIRMIELSSAERIQEIAEKRLGMVPIQKAPRVVYYEEKRPPRQNKELLAANLEPQNFVSINPSMLLKSAGE